MRTNDLKTVKVLTEEALIQKVRILRGELAEIILDKNMGKLKDVKAISKKKKDLAQVLTTLRQKQMLRGLEASIKGQEIRKEDEKIANNRKKDKEEN